MKKKFIYLLMVSLISTNVVYAAKWVTIKTSNGKTALLDHQNIEILNPYVKYWVKATKSGYTYRYYMMSDCSSQTSCIVETYKYDSTGKFVSSSENGINLEKIIPDTLNEALHRNVCDLLRQNPLSIDSDTLSAYFQAVNKRVKQAWKPKYSKTKEINLIAKVKYKVDKNGNVLSKEITHKSGNKNYDKSIEEGSSSIKTFSSLPNSFAGNLEFIITYNYALKGESIQESSKLNNNGIGEIAVSKSKLHVGKAVLDGFIGIIAFPFVILGALLK